MPMRGYEKAMEWLSRLDGRRDAARLMAPLRTLGEIPGPGNEAGSLAVAPRYVDPPECGPEDISAALSQLSGLVRDLTSMAECAARMAWNNVSQINHGVGNADNAVTAVEALAKEVSPDGDSSRAVAANALRLSFNTTVQMVGARSSAKRLSEALQGVLELARETQNFADALRERLDAGGLRDAVPGKISCCG